MRSATFLITLSTATALCSPALGGVVQLPQTGQTIQQAAGDDGALKKGAAWPVPRFVANPDQTVSDNLTGLMWNSNGNTATPAGQCGTSGSNRSWSQALTYVACLNTNVYLGYADWRLPSVTELETLSNAGQTDSAAWLNSQGFSAIQTGFYWSSTSDAFLPADFAWSVQLSSGATFSDDKTATLPVVAVRRGPTGEPLAAFPANNRRSGQSTSIAAGDDGALQRGVSWPSARFTTPASGSGVVNDNLTRLVWLKDAGTPTVGACTGGHLTWSQAISYVDCLNGLNYQGRSDWRLPNRNELESLVDYSASAPALPAAHPFTNLAGTFWSATSDAADGGSAWYLTPFDGSLFTAPKAAAVNVWPVGGPDATTTAPSRSAVLPKTGQTVSVAAGDDGARKNGYPWPSSRFTDNGQTLTDTLTGLEWSKNADAPDPGACRPAINGAEMTWQEALTYVACLNTNQFQGHGDWRLPAINELESLTDAGAADGTAALTARGFTGVKNDYWSSTSDVAGLSVPADAAWTVRMTSGEVFSLSKDNQTLLSAWPVRTASGSAIARPWQSGQTLCYDAAGAAISCAATGQDGQLKPGIAWPEPRFTANGNQTATDALTGLIWPVDASTPTVGNCSGGILSWADALAYVTCLNSAQYLGFNDWRLPNRRELRSLVNYGASQPALPTGHPFTGVSGNYWSSTGKAGDATTALSINLAFADQSEFAFDNTFSVLPVRGGQNIAADKGYLDFGTPDLNAANVSLPLSITNRGGTDLSIASATINGTNSTLFSLGANSCNGVALAPGASCSMTVSFTPSAEGFKEGALTVASNDPDTPSLRLVLAGNVPDKRAPAVSIASPLTGFANKRDKQLSFSASDGYVRVYMNNTLISKVSGDALPLLVDGDNTIRVEATDLAGNTGSAQTTVTFVAPTGELDGNSGITVGDALRALRVSVGLDQATGALFFSGDVAPLVNGVPSPNGVIDISDALIILRKVVGLENF